MGRVDALIRRAIAASFKTRTGGTDRPYAGAGMSRHSPLRSPVPSSDRSASVAMGARSEALRPRILRHGAGLVSRPGSR